MGLIYHFDGFVSALEEWQRKQLELKVFLREDEHHEGRHFDRRKKSPS